MEGPGLPMGVSDHCVVWMNQTKILLMGGYTESEGYSENTLIYDSAQ